MARYERVILLAVFIGAIGVPLLAPSATYASPVSTFTQQILPLNCVFETVNDGTGTLHYLTPTECGIYTVVPPTSNLLDNPVSDTPIVLPFPVQTRDQIYRQPTNTPQARAALPAQSLTNVSGVITHDSSNSPKITVAVVAGTASVLTIVVLLLFLL